MSNIKFQMSKNIGNWILETGSYLKLKNNLRLLFFYLLLLFLPTQFGKHFWPSYTSFYGFRIDYLSPTLYLTDIMVILLLFSWTFSQCSIKSQFLLIKNSFHISHFIFPLLFLGVVFAGILFSKQPLAGFYGLLKLCEMGLFALFIVKNAKTLSYRVCAALFSIIILYEALIGFFQFVLHHSLGSIFYFLGERAFTSTTPGIANASIGGSLVLRPYGTFSHPNVFAGFLVLTMVFLLTNIPRLPTRLEKMFSALSLLIGTCMLFLTLSRVAIVVWLVLFGVFALKNKWQTKKQLSAALGIIVVFLLLTPAVPRIFQTRMGEEAVTIRASLAKSAGAMLLRRPLFGVGVNNFLLNLFSVQTRHSFQTLQPVHNIFLLIASETGIIGLSFVVWGMYLSLRKAWKTYQAGVTYPLPGLCAFLALGLFDHYFLTLQQGQLITAFLFGVVWAKKQ